MSGPICATGVWAPSPERSPGHEALDCIICLDIVVDAHQSSCCGALLCGRCIAMPSVKERCPHCRHERPAFYKDPFRERQAAAVVLTCKSCSFSGKRDTFLAHTHESAEDKVKLLEKNVEQLEAELKKKDAALSQKTEALTREAQAHEAELATIQKAILASSGQLDLIWRAALKHRIVDRAFVTRHVFSGVEGSISQAWQNGSHEGKVDIWWQHNNVSVFFTVTASPIQSVQMQLLHPNAAEDKMLSVTPRKLGEPWGRQNWMSTKEMENFCHDGEGSIFFALHSG